MTVALRVAGSLWSAPPQQVVDEAVRLAEAGLTYLHWDLTDGEFAVPGGFAADRAARVTAVAGVGAEAHLMVREPLAHIDAWTGFCDVVTVHVESRRWCAAVDRIACRGAVPAVAVSPGTSASAVQAHGEAARLGVLVMSVEPGRAGSTFDPRTPDRVREVGGRRLLGVDGAVTSDRVPDLVSAGASWVVSGTDLLRSPDPAGWLSRVGTPGSGPTGW